ncbi:hypothetical protein AE618_13140 [Bosea vaviloviae]|uniref:Uncharacterized protein n=2 Tax=Bosea vaviloviae TaxID=1526658 RepID=A0A0N0MC53_9HYPH|nr:hypothetical protein AE618_13140 [Bosea vaviloviae]
METKGWSYFSIIDMCVLRAVVVMTEHGLAVDDAVWHADKWLRLNFAALLEDRDTSYLHGFMRGSSASSGPTAFVDEISGQVSSTAPDHWPRDASASFISIGPEENVGAVLAWARGAITIFDLRAVTGHVLTELAALQPETVATAEDTRRIVFGTLADALRPKPNAEGDDT